MKKLLTLLLVLPIWVGCNQKDDPVSRSKEFTHTGCSSLLATRAGSDDGGRSLLTLKYEDGDLRVIRTNAMMNCSIKDHGMVCEATIEGKVIHYTVTETDGPTANCMCRVKEMSSVVTGLKVGKKYTFDYFCSREYDPFTFVFKEGMVMIQDLDPHYWLSGNN